MAERVMGKAEAEWRKENPLEEPLVHFSRVCGYYSRVGSWNKSKIGELKDRKRGIYDVQDTHTDGR